MTIDVAVHKRLGMTVVGEEWVEERQSINDDLKKLKDLSPDERKVQGELINERIKKLKDLER